MSVSRKKLISIAIAATIVVSVISVAIFIQVRPNPRVVGELTPSDVRVLQRMARTLRNRDYRSPHPYAGAALAQKLMYRVRAATAKMEIMERPSVGPDTVWVLYRDRFNTNHTYAYWFKTNGANGWTFSSARETLK